MQIKNDIYLYDRGASKAWREEQVEATTENRKYKDEYYILKHPPFYLCISDCTGYLRFSTE